MVTGNIAVIYVSARQKATPGGAGSSAFMSFAVSGASTVSAADADSCETLSPNSLQQSRMSLYTATATGTHTFTAKYKVVGSTTGEYFNRRIIAFLLK